MKSLVFVLLVISSFLLKAQTDKFTGPIIDEQMTFEEQDGLVAVEAEYFYKQHNSELRQWYRTTRHQAADITPDKDNNHGSDASNYTYLEILPDTRTTHDDELIRGENFSNKAGKLGVLHYKVKINDP